MTSSPANSASAAVEAQTAALTTAVNDLTLCGAELAKCMRGKQRILVENELANLEAAAAGESTLAARFAQLENERNNAQVLLAQQLGLDSDATLSSTLSALMQLDGQAGSNGAADLDSACTRLAEQMIELAQLNADNAHLAANALDYTRMLLGALSSGGQQPAYGSDGKVANGSPHELVSINA